MALMLTAVAALSVLSFIETKTAALDDRALMTKRLTEVAQSLLVHYETLATSGQMPLDQAQHAALDSIAALRFAQSDYFFVGDLNGNLIANAFNKKNIGKNQLDQLDVPGGKRYFAEMVEVAKSQGSGFVSYLKPRPGGTEPVEKIASVQVFKPWGWFIATGLYLDDVHAAVRSRGITNALWSAGLSLPILAILLLISRGLSRPIVRITAAMRALASGDLRVRVEGETRRDEIGLMARAVQVFKEGLIAKQAADLAAADEADAKMRRANLLDDLTKRFERNVSVLTQGLAGAATEMEATAQTMTVTADETTQQTLSVVGAAQQTSANVQTVAAASEEMSASVAEIVHQVSQSAQIANVAVEKAQQTDATVQRLAGTAERISSAVSLISGIAAQTNLLALNATIEAARAGEAGRGFAVVATEVKELAGQTSRATAEISERITEIQDATSEAVADIREIGRVIAEMSTYAGSIAAAMEEQGAATQEITRNVQQAAAGTDQVTRNITGVREGAGQTSTAASQVLNAAQELARHSVSLSEEVATFLSDVKAA